MSSCESHHHPCTAVAFCAQLLGDGLKVQHKLGLTTDELADFIDKEYKALIAALLVEVPIYPFGEVLDGERQPLFEVVDERLRVINSLVQDLAESITHFGGIELGTSSRSAFQSML